jgi:hypothetical protein
MSGRSGRSRRAHGRTSERRAVCGEAVWPASRWGGPEQPAHGSWRRPDPRAVVALNALMARLRAVIRVLRTPSWWGVTD